MAKIKLPKVRWLCQDLNGCVNIAFESDNAPYVYNEDFGWLFPNLGIYEYIKGKQNQDWQNTLIDLETDDYDFTDGILTRIEKE